MKRFLAQSRKGAKGKTLVPFVPSAANRLIPYPFPSRLCGFARAKQNHGTATMNDYLKRLAPAPRHALRLAIRELAEGKGDIKPLCDELRADFYELA